MKNLHKLVVASAFALAASASQAATVVDNWDFTLDLNWVPSASTFTTGTSGTPQRNSITEISWGAGVQGQSYGSKKYDYHNLSADPNYARSGLEISKPHEIGNVSTDGASVPANMFTHYNNAISASFANLAHTQMTASVALALPGTTTPVTTITRTFEVYFYETPNVAGNCAWGKCEDDIFAIIGGPNFGGVFDYDGVTYQFNYFDTNHTIQPLSKAACEAVVVGSASPSCYGFVTKENGKTDVNFSFNVQAINVPVPEPETYAMLLAGLGLVGFVARRRRNTVRN